MHRQELDEGPLRNVRKIVDATVVFPTPPFLFAMTIVFMFPQIIGEDGRKHEGFIAIKWPCYVHDMAIL